MSVVNICGLNTNLILNFVFSVHLKIMTAVTSHQCLPELIHEMPPGHAKDVVLRLCGNTDRSATFHASPG